MTKSEVALLNMSLCMNSMVLRPNWVFQDGITNKNNNAYVIIGHDGLDTVFAII